MIMKNRKLTFTLADGSILGRTHRIMELCEYLTAKVVEPQFAREGKKWNQRFMDFFTFDNASDPLEPTGNIRFTVPPMFAGHVLELQNAILQELSALKIKTGPLVYERGPVVKKVQAILIPIIENPTALAAPPDVNMSQMRACVVLRDLLGYQRVNGRYEFGADDLLKRVSGVTEERIAACTSSPVKVAQEVRRTPSAASVKATRRCLEELKALGAWAKANKHPKLAAF